MANRERLDVLVWQRGLAPSRAKARALILAGQIAVNGERTTRAGTPVDLQATVTRLGATSPYVSRGGEKLAAALVAFNLTLHGRVAMDVGASTGGFTDCLLQAGALRVYAVDVGYGQLHWRLRTDPRVIVYERTNARYLQPEDVPERLAVLTVDVSFISLRLLLPVLVRLLEPQADSVVLIKPQFEVGKGQVGKSGVVHNPQQHQQVLWDILIAAQDCGFAVRAAIVSPLLGPKGNREFLAHLQLGATAMPLQSLQELCAHLALPAQVQS
jgi:23S rRNA (cytidine1920-2'-O)/16S rRNA (cytidine1409-2'-O)-methyltransferase